MDEVDYAASSIRHSGTRPEYSCCTGLLQYSIVLGRDNTANNH